MTRLILIRHGQTAWNAEGRFQGQQDPPLNETGWRQARELAERIRHVGIQVVYSSTLKRAYQTAQVLAEVLGVPHHEDSRLNEIHQGHWETLFGHEIAKKYPEIFEQWGTDPWAVTIPGGENLKQVQTRIHAAIGDILESHRGKCIGVVAHRIPIALLKIKYQSIDPNLVRRIDLPNIYWEEMPLTPGRPVSQRSTRILGDAPSE